MNATILIIDDDTKLTTLLSGYLGKFGMAVESASDPEKGLAILKKSLPDLVILDIMLPGMDGFEVCRRIRKNHTVPIIMLTARGDVADRIVGLELGADDYLPKPFEPRELVARIQSVLRRSADAKEGRRIVAGDLELDLDGRGASLAGKKVDLTAMEFDLLTLFARNPGVVLDRDRIFESIKGLDDDSFDRSIDVLVSRVRGKLGDDPRNPRLLKTVRGAGYKFIGHTS
ncbi:MAG: response regulator transcription factor [Spirochaetes bacterium]|nr:response regulator transcription factor [Spirochaetota bacterium]